MEPNPLKDRAVHEGDDPLGWNEFINSIHIRIFMQLPVSKF
jgi:hypothetical protein